MFSPFSGTPILPSAVFLVSNRIWDFFPFLFQQLKDCNVVASKLVLLLDDLLWVLTDSQLKAMAQYSKSLSEVIEKSAQQRKSMASAPTQVVVYKLFNFKHYIVVVIMIAHKLI